jgi:hypothetical protein
MESMDGTYRTSISMQYMRSTIDQVLGFGSELRLSVELGITRCSSVYITTASCRDCVRYLEHR